MGRFDQMFARVAAAPTTRVGPATTRVTLSRGGVDWLGIATSPVELHKLAGLDKDLYALSRMIYSEVGHRHPAYLISAGECVRSRAADGGVGVYHRLVGMTSEKYAHTRWHYGRQPGRIAATDQDPTQRTLTAAKIILHESSDLNGPGTCTFYEPKLQDKLASKERGDAIHIAKTWANRDGYEWIGPLPHCDTYLHAVVRKVKGRKAEWAPLVEAIERSRRGEKMIGAPESPSATHAQVGETGTPWWLLASAAAAGLLIG